MKLISNLKRLDKINQLRKRRPHEDIPGVDFVFERKTISDLIDAVKESLDILAAYGTIHEDNCTLKTSNFKINKCNCESKDAFDWVQKWNREE